MTFEDNVPPWPPCDVNFFILLKAKPIQGFVWLLTFKKCQVTFWLTPSLLHVSFGKVISTFPLEGHVLFERPRLTAFAT